MRKRLGAERCNGSIWFDFCIKVNKSEQIKSKEQIKSSEYSHTQNI